ncbi:MAG: hypothetical protein IKZ94_08275, partial [Lachnospiraceae bacterium]|nr:hypothetical protein [Lachnospiraceae bacterium]
MEDNNLHKNLLNKSRRLLFWGHVVTTVFIVIGLISQAAVSGLPVYYSVIPLFAAILLLLCAIGVYVKFKGTYTYPRFVIYGFLVVYALMLFFSEKNTTYPYIIPLLVGIVITLDIQTVKITTFSFLIINIIKVVMMLASNPMEEVIEYVMITLIVCILTTVC